MTLRERFEEFDKTAPVRTATVMGKEFPYRYYRNPDERKNVTLLMLAGGSGLGDGFFYLYEYLMPHFSLLSFNYPIAFPDNSSLSDAIAELIKTVGAENVYLLGQSYGGLIAQITASRHPECIKGMILSGTAGLGKNMPRDGIETYEKMFNREKYEKNLKIDRKLPVPLLVPLFKIMAGKVVKDRELRKTFSDIIDICRRSMTGEYFALMDTLLYDVRNYVKTETSEDFESYRGECLIFFSDDDKIFTQSMKEDLVSLMPEATVVWNLKGGHLAMMVSMDGYIRTLLDFLGKNNENYREAQLLS